jgi:predicted ATPase
MAGRRALLVLDNFEHVLEASSLVASLLSACPGPVVLATSREALNITAEQRYSVEALALPSQPERATVTEVESAAATAMFLDAARRRDPQLMVSANTAPKIARLCTRLDGLPLALELAAARVGLLGLSDLTDSLDGTVADLGPASRDTPDRQKTLDATVDWSYRLLDAGQRRCFARFALFAGGASMDTAQVVTAAATGTFHALIARSLLARRELADGRSRLVMLQTIRDCALARFAEDPEQTEVRRRHLEHYKRLVNQIEPKVSVEEDPTALKVLDVEIENIYVALAWALENDASAALQLAGDLASYWAARRDRAGLTWLESALARAADASDRDRARAKLGMVFHLLLHERYDGCREAADEALELYRAIGDEAGIAQAFCELAAVTIVVTGDRGKAREYAEASCRHARIADDDLLLGRALSWLAPMIEGDERSAVLGEAANLLTPAGDNRSVAWMYTNAAYSELQADRPHHALRLLRLALPAAEKLDTVSTRMFLHGNVGLAHLLAGNLSEARTAYEDQLELCAGQSFRSGPDEALVGLAAISACEGQFERAARLFGAARALGYPNTPAAEPIHARLEREYLAAARSRYGPEAWRRAEDTGAALSFEDAVAFGTGRGDHKSKRLVGT